jgi:hypothetical protein
MISWFQILLSNGFNLCRYSVALKNKKAFICSCARCMDPAGLYKLNPVDP